MSLRALLYAYVLGGITFIPLVIFTCICITIYTSVPVSNDDTTKNAKSNPQQSSEHDPPKDTLEPTSESPSELNDLPRTRKGWLTVRRTFEESSPDGSYVTFVKSYLDARSKDPKRSRPKDMWYVVLKGKVMYLYEDEGMTECEAAIELGGHDVVIYPEGLLDGELFTRRNAICLKPRTKASGTGDGEDSEKTGMESGETRSRERDDDAARQESWFIFVRSLVDMEDWYLALIHASDQPSGTPTLNPLKPVFLPLEMNYLVTTLDEQPDVIPMRWLNALLGRIFYSFYRTQAIESYIIGRLMKKLSKVKRPAFLTELAITQFSVGNKAPTFSKPMLKELTKEGDASLEVGLAYKGEIRATVEATAVINLGARFKSYTVKLVLAVVLRELEGNLLIKVKRPPSSRIWYAFTKTPRMVINVEPIVSDRQITWSMILNTIESKIEEIIIDSVVMPNMDDISFFDSIDYEHRGGIWADAVRLEKPMEAPISEQDVRPTANDVGAQPSEEAGPSMLARTQPILEFPPEAPSSLDTIHIIRSTSSDRPSKTARRRSWFSSGTEDELHDEHVREGAEEEVLRGRSERIAKPESSPLSPLPDVDTPTAHPSDFSDYDHDAHAYITPQLPSRPPSAHSSYSQRSRAHSISSSVGGDESTNYLSDSSAASKSPRHSHTTSTTSSFLSALKSKAGDKQALSNTAKEAMRKWGVNWGLKKDHGENSTMDDLPDGGAPDQRSRTESTQGRQSYADVRAAVAERREREQVDRAHGNSSSSIPVPIPSANGGTKGRSPSMSGPRVTSYSGGFPTSPGIYSDEGSASNLSKSTGPSLSRSLGDTSNDSFKDRDLMEVAEGHPAPSLIHTQPSQARMMTIPGIHASHKGEVMSMGNVAPVSPAPEGKLKGPTIQSVYRLWKSPILTGQPQSEAGSSSSTVGRGDMNDRNHDVAPLSLTPDAILPPARAVPPPLPPRTISTVAVRHTTDEDSSVVSTASLASEALKSVVSRDETKRGSVELGVAAVNVDGETAQPAEPTSRALEGVPSVTPTMGSDKKPPLPPRRIHVPA